MTFDPRESVDFNGNTGPFIQYTYARIQSVLRKAVDSGIEIPQAVASNLEIAEKESFLIQMLANFSNVVAEAGREMSPAMIANYTYDLAKEYNQFYHDFPIAKEENDQLRDFRLVLSKLTGEVIKNGMRLLGINVPDRM